MVSDHTYGKVLPASVDAPTAPAGSASDTDADRRRITLIQRLVLMNLGLVAVQALSAGFLMSGYGRALAIHAAVALALQAGALVQAIVALSLRRRQRVPASVAATSVGLLLFVFLQMGLGHNRIYWLHVPIGVGLFGGLIRQTARLDTLRPSEQRHTEVTGQGEPERSRSSNAQRLCEAVRPLQG